MAFRDFQDFIKRLDDRGELKRIKAEVDAELEITEIIDRVCKKYGPALGELPILKCWPGHARKIMNSVWGMGQLMHTKMIIVIDEKISSHDLSTTIWKAFNNIDAKRDVVISEGPLDALDHALNLPRYGYRMGIDATKKWPGEGYTREWPDDVECQMRLKN